MQHWFRKFRNEGEGCEEEQSRGRTLTVDNEELEVLVEVELTANNDSTVRFKVRCKSSYRSGLPYAT